MITFLIFKYIYINFLVYLFFINILVCKLVLYVLHYRLLLIDFYYNSIGNLNFMYDVYIFYVIFM